MATYTDNYNLIKPTYAETADIVPLNNNFEKIDEVMHASQTSLAPAYDQTASYQPGDVVMHELNMYKCTGATSGAWDPSKWTRTTAAETGGGGSVDFDIFGEGSGSVVTITDGAKAGLAECIVEIEATQSGSGTPSPSNVRPIVGRSEVNVSVSGKNLISPNIADYLTYGSYKYFKIPTYKEGDYIMSFTDKDTSVDISGCYIGFMSNYPTENTQYRWCIANGTIQSNTTNTSQIDNTTKCNTIIVYPNNEATFNKIFSRYNVQVERGTTATEFAPYITPEVTNIPLDRTVYGGTLDVTRGVLTVTHAIVNLGSLSWTRTTDYTNPIFYAQITDKMNSSIDSICEWYANGGLITGPTTINALQNGYFGCGNNSEYIYVRDDQYTSVSDFTSATASVKFYYELATPQTFNLTPTQVETLLGQNYVSHDGGGTISLVYVKGDAPIKPNPTGADIPLKGIEIDGEKFSIPSGEMEIISITAGDGTTVRTFTFSKTPKFIKIYWEDTVLDGGWIADFEIVWGQPFVDYKAHARYVSYTGLAGGCASIVYPSDNKSMILTGGNAFGACNSTNGSGLIYVQY